MSGFLAASGSSAAMASAAPSTGEMYLMASARRAAMSTLYRKSIIARAASLCTAPLGISMLSVEATSPSVG